MGLQSVSSYYTKSIGGVSTDDSTRFPGHVNLLHAWTDITARKRTCDARGVKPERTTGKSAFPTVSIYGTLVFFSHRAGRTSCSTGLSDPSRTASLLAAREVQFVPTRTHRASSHNDHSICLRRHTASGRSNKLSVAVLSH